MTALWKNSPLSWWGRRYTTARSSRSATPSALLLGPGWPGARSTGSPGTGLDGPRPCGWDDFTAHHTRRQPTGKDGEVEYAEDGVVCAPGASCTEPLRYSAYCRAVGGGPDASRQCAWTKMDGRVFQALPTGT